ncbi:uncharacterized protein BX664DRAFT_322772 [Halteromyces radiatus]|uniref:uncharacterized protein n=1 Tax=Halteromyces radiatus TaxID=101107 RepID=UPI00221E5BAD|nr:uncharacterized protein BX664DRAFT_322772 [Halteromyces radiatus]KAI8100061.1 hypothetical protein BX664DRAFT_322772 [Halteromyces radiatus]
MDYLDIDIGGQFAASSILYRLYIAATVTFAIGFAGSLRTLKSKQQLPYPQTIISFTLVNGIIFRAISLAYLSDYENDRSHLLSPYDYARIIFFTISNLTFHLIPVVTAHRLYAFRNKSVVSGLSGVMVLISYFFTMVIVALVISMMALGSTIPWNSTIMNSLVGNNTTGDLGQLPTFLHLMDASNMVYWWYVVAYIVILVEHYVDFGWSFLAVCVLTIISQIVLTIASFLPQIMVFPSGFEIKMILQFIFIFQFPFIALMIATARGYLWLPPPLDHFDDDEELDDMATR